MEKNLVEAPIDNKNLCEDPFEDDVFRDFYEARDHRERKNRHLVGFVQVRDERIPSCINAEGYVDVSWGYGDNTVTIKLLAANTCCDEFEETKRIIFEYYTKIFSGWMNDDNENLVVRFGSENDSLYVHFYFDTTKS